MPGSFGISPRSICLSRIPESFRLKDDHLLFERLVLEINQAGLSWIAVLKKQDNFRRAYDGFDVDRVAAYKEKDCIRLLNDAGSSATG